MKPAFDIAADLDTPVSAYLKLRPFRPRFLLESVEGGERLGRYSFLGFGDGLEVRLDAAGLAIGAERRPVPRNQAELLDALRTALARAPRPQAAGGATAPLAGGLVGFAGYDLVRFFEHLPARVAADIATPDACYVAPKSLLVFDHLTRGVTLLHDGPDAERESLKREIVRALRGALPDIPARAGSSPPRGSLSRDEFLGRVGRVKEYIAAGDVYQLVLAVRFAGECELDPFQAYRALRLLNPSPYMYYCECGDLTVCGSSPEALVKVNAGHAELRPIAGTLPRGATPEADLANEQQLLADPKENAEHVMLVDLARNDLGRVARPGSVHVDPYRSIERYSHVMHIVSGVKGEVRPDCDAFDLFGAAFPAGTLVGAPKVRAMQIIDELEPVRRGLYGGTVGYFGHGGDMDQAITIRTLVFTPGRYTFQAGAGIVADSEPAREYDEILAKSGAMRRALELVGEGL